MIAMIRKRRATATQRGSNTRRSSRRNHGRALPPTTWRGSTPRRGGRRGAMRLATIASRNCAAVRKPRTPLDGRITTRALDRSRDRAFERAIGEVTRQPRLSLPPRPRARQGRQRRQARAQSFSVHSTLKTDFAGADDARQAVRARSQPLNTHRGTAAPRRDGGASTLVLAGEIRDRSRDAQHAVVTPRRQRQLRQGGVEDRAARQLSSAVECTQPPAV